MTNDNVIKLLNLFKLDVYTGASSKAYIEDIINKSAGNLIMRAGQKRIVVFDPSKPNIVYKVAYSKEGIQDNMNEVITSNILTELLSSGQITQEDIKLFALARLTQEGDPFIIEQDFTTNFVDDNDFKTWLKSQAVVAELSTAGSINENQAFPVYVASHNQLHVHYNRIASILANFFVPSDVSIINEPKNFGIRNGYLTLLDMGSVIPLFVNNMNQIIYPTMGMSNTPMSYVAAELRPGMTYAQIQNLNSGTYREYNPTNNYALAANDEHFVLVSDDAVFELYIRNNIELYNRLCAIHCRMFNPPMIFDNGVRRIVTTFDDYDKVYQMVTGISLPPNMLNQAWSNHVFSEVASMIKHTPAVAGCGMFNMDPSGVKVQLTFFQYVDLIINTFLQFGFDYPRNYVIALAAIQYLRAIAFNTQNPVETLNAIYGVQPDAFFANISQIINGITQDEAHMLYYGSVGLLS